MNKKQTYITDEEKEKCQKVVDAFAELFENEDLAVVNAGKYGLCVSMCRLILCLLECVQT